MPVLPDTKLDIPCFGTLVITDTCTETKRGEFHQLTITFTPNPHANTRKGLVVTLDSRGNHTVEEITTHLLEDLYDGSGVA